VKKKQISEGRSQEAGTHGDEYQENEDTYNAMDME
jgi:hypothetical protein